MSVLAARLEQRWASAADHPELEFTDARASATPPTVIQAAHEASEARAVARAVLEALQRGAALDRIAVVPVDAADPFLEPLRAELTAARVPFSEAWTSPPRAPLRKHTRRWNCCVWHKAPLLRDSLVDVLRVPDLRLTSFLGESTRAGFVEAILAGYRCGVDRTGRELLAALDARRRRTRPEQEREREALSAAERVLSGLVARFEQLRKPSTRRAFREAWRDLFSELGLLTASRRGLNQAIRYAERADQAPIAALGENARAGRAIDLALERVVAAGELLQLGDESLELAEFYREFASALASVGPSQGAGRAGTLRVARPAEVAGLDWDLLIVCRAASSTLDWQSTSSDGVLDADLIEQLPLEKRPLGAADRALFTRFALAHALSRAKHSVVTWAKRDARGGSGASRLVMNLKTEDSRVEPASPLDPNAQRVLAIPRPSAEVQARAGLELARQAFYGNPDAPLDFGNGAARPARQVGGRRRAAAARPHPTRALRALRFFWDSPGSCCEPCATMRWATA